MDPFLDTIMTTDYTWLYFLMLEDKRALLQSSQKLMLTIFPHIRIPDLAPCNLHVFGTCKAFLPDKSVNPLKNF